MSDLTVIYSADASRDIGSSIIALEDTQSPSRLGLGSGLSSSYQAACNLAAKAFLGFQNGLLFLSICMQRIIFSFLTPWACKSPQTLCHIFTARTHRHMLCNQPYREKRLRHF